VCVECVSGRNGRLHLVQHVAAEYQEGAGIPLTKYRPCITICVDCEGVLDIGSVWSSTYNIRARLKLQKVARSSLLVTVRSIKQKLFLIQYYSSITS
jgi:hypothetical protein